MKLPELRQEIDKLDRQIVALLHERASLVHQVGLIKQDSQSPIFVPEREADLYRKIADLNGGKLPEGSLRAIYREIISCSFSLEGGFKVAYLGPAGTWSHQASLKQFGSSVELMPMHGFAAVFDAVERHEADYGVIPIENSTGGSVTDAMDLFIGTTLNICAQIQLRICNCLLGNIRPEDIKTLYSHPQVLLQCRQWIRNNFPAADLVETSSTTVAAQIAVEKASEGAAALGGALAAELFGLQILESNIQDKASNTTRFAIIGHQKTQPTGNDRTSLCFTVRHTAGSLVSVLEKFKQYGISLLRIESRPSKIIDWEYVFYVDAAGHAEQEPLKTCLDEVADHCSILKVFGSYPEATSLC